MLKQKAKGAILSGKGELALIDWIRRRKAPTSPIVNIGIGDDLAGLRIGSEQVLFGCDQALDGVHFKLKECGTKKAGRKALARNLSDVAAMAAVPLAAVASVALPDDMSMEQAQQIVNGMGELAQQFNCPVVGGDIGSWSGPLAIDVSIVAKAAGLKPVRRSGARPGDAIMVTGELGGAIMGKHLSFTPLVKEARALAEAVNLHAMIDISDGLAMDLHHIVAESNCGAKIWAGKIPISSAAKELAKKHGDRSLDHSLSDGEDYELLFTLSAKETDRARNILSSLGIRVSQIGEITKGAVVLVDKNGNEQELPAVGFEHFKGRN